MRKFIIGLIVGMVLSLSLFVGIDKINSKSANEGITEEQSIQMELAYYRYHHDTLSKALSGK